mmetsp:Transcript_9685/g.17491  ORF Transcript_9685/g.17491 Transcript_9685/m.17491 type:complete len:177 (+) Transcript_9685:70-600(+)
MASGLHRIVFFSILATYCAEEGLDDLFDVDMEDDIQPHPYSIAPPSGMSTYMDSDRGAEQSYEQAHEVPADSSNLMQEGDILSVTEADALRDEMQVLSSRETAEAARVRELTQQASMLEAALERLELKLEFAKESKENAHEAARAAEVLDQAKRMRERAYHAIQGAVQRQRMQTGR